MVPAPIPLSTTTPSCHNPTSSLLLPFPVVYGATITTTLTTTLTASSSQSLITLAYPVPAITLPLFFTTRTRTAHVVSKGQPKPFIDIGDNELPILETLTLPVLVLTKVDGIMVDEQGRKLTRGSLVQSVAASVSGDLGPQQTIIAVPGYKEQVCEGKRFECWSMAQKAGSMVAVVVLGLGVLLLIWILSMKCVRGKREDVEDDEASDDERGHGGDGEGNGHLKDESAAPLNAMQPMALVPDDVVDDHGKNSRGALFLWNKKRLLKRPPRSTSTTAVCATYTAPPVVITPAPTNMTTIITPSGGVQYAPLTKQYTSSGSAEPILAQDFAYRVNPNGVQLINQPPPIATVDANSAEQERRRQERRLRRTQNDLVLKKTAGGLRDRRSEEQKAYDRGHQRRRRHERSRSQVSENYERRGDRLRKESPEAREAEKVEQGLGEQNASKLRGRRKSSEGQSAGERARNIMLGVPRDSIRERRGRSGSASDRGHSEHRRDQSTDHVYDVADAEKRGLLHKGSGRSNRYYPPLSNSRGLKHDSAYMQGGLDDLGRRSSFDQSPETLIVRVPRGDSPCPRRSQSAGKRTQQEVRNTQNKQGGDRDYYGSADPSNDRAERQRRYREHSPREQPNLSPQRRPSKKGGVEENRKSGSKTTKLMTLLPIALATIDALAEPSGGWQQYHRKDGKTANHRRSSSVEDNRERRRRHRQPREYHRRGSSLDRNTMQRQENTPMQTTDPDFLDTNPKPHRDLWRRHVKIVTQERSSENTVVRGGSEKSEPTKRVRISEQSVARTPVRSPSR